MKSKFTALLTLALMMTPLSLLAASHYSESITISDPVTVGGTQVPAGTYKVQWDGTGSVNATIAQGKKVIATVPATVTPAKSNYDGALETDGKTLQGIEWHKVAIQFNGPAAGATSAGN
jgi:hypothetical protein